MLIDNFRLVADTTASLQYRAPSAGGSTSQSQI